MSVAPAQAYATPEPLISVASNVLPTPTVIQPIPASIQLPATTVELDPLAPTMESDELTDQPIVETPRPTGDLSSKVAALRGTNPGSRELECLAVGIYYESKSEPLAGQLAVGQVIANRAKSGRFASTYCGVLFQRSQFSFVRGGSYPAPARSSRQWENAVAVAKIVDGKLHSSSVPNALFFHAKRVSPGWRLARVGSVGNHIFYR
ncbi:cell wall hydrolase [Sphingomonas sp.]|uniref:cell wall hydrolase n=1 Tax=Sphingomonas sp. TaxID=28214 RepID=UPI00286A18BE|nr:cell wall hydrolase [Sphingomonas sp.]